jgi:hypothetical protein
MRVQDRGGLCGDRLDSEVLFLKPSGVVILGFLIMNAGCMMIVASQAELP